MAIQFNSNYNETMPFSDVCFQVGLGANVDELVTVPGSDTIQYQAFFEYASNSNVFVCKNAVATIPPIGTVGTQPYNEFKPEKRYVRGGDVIHLITPDATAYVGVSLRQIQGS
jgi:hypothetical protein